MNSAGLVTFVGVAHPWMCDAMGHVNVRHYTAMFDDASFQLLGRLAVPDDRLGWADARCEIDYHHEIAAGSVLTIHSYVERLGNSSLTCTHVLTGSVDGTLHAKARIVTVRFDLTTRSKTDLGVSVRTNAEALLRREG